MGPFPCSPLSSLKGRDRDGSETKSVMMVYKGVTGVL